MGVVGGTFYQTVVLASPEAPTRGIELKLLVDTGATWTWIPEAVLRGIGLAPAYTRSVKLADGRVVQRNAGLALITIGQETLPTVCLFGDDGSDPLLGAVTLEEFGLGVDPVGRRLIPVVGHLATLSPSTPQEKPVLTQRKKFTLKQLLARVSRRNLHGEVDSGPSVGQEACTPRPGRLRARRARIEL